MSNQIDIPEARLKMTYDRWMAREKSLADLAAEYGVCEQVFTSRFKKRGWPGPVEVRGRGGAKKRTRPLLVKPRREPVQVSHPPHIWGTDGECCVCDERKR